MPDPVCSVWRSYGGDADAVSPPEARVHVIGQAAARKVYCGK
jgi:hypothetical protein